MEGRFHRTDIGLAAFRRDPERQSLGATGRAVGTVRRFQECPTRSDMADQVASRRAGKGAPEQPGHQAGRREPRFDEGALAEWMGGHVEGFAGPMEVASVQRAASPIRPNQLNTRRILRHAAQTPREAPALGPMPSIASSG